MCIPSHSAQFVQRLTELEPLPAPPARRLLQPSKCIAENGRPSWQEFRRIVQPKGRELLFTKWRRRPEPNRRFQCVSACLLLRQRKYERGCLFRASAPMHLIAPRTCTATAAFTCLVAVTAKYRTIAARFKWNSRWLAAARADHRCSVGWSRTITGASPTLFALLCLTARLAALGGRITAFLKERLIRSGERKILSTITARKLNVSGHGSPRGDCTYELVNFI